MVDQISKDELIYKLETVIEYLKNMVDIIMSKYERDILKYNWKCHLFGIYTINSSFILNKSWNLNY